MLTENTFIECLNAMREIILDCVDIHHNRIEFDTVKAEAKEHDMLDIVAAEQILLTNGHFTDRFADDMNTLFSGTQLNRETEFKPVVFYIPVVKMIFIINVQEQISTHIYEEDLVKELAIRETFFSCLEVSVDGVKAERRKIQYSWSKI